MNALPPELAGQIKARFIEIMGEVNVSCPQRSNFFLTWCNELHQGRLVTVQDPRPDGRTVEITIHDPSLPVTH